MQFHYEGHNATTKILQGMVERLYPKEDPTDILWQGYVHWMAFKQHIISFIIWNSS
jgi:hypothetical protein